MVASVATAWSVGSAFGDVLYFAITVPLCVLTWWGALRHNPDGYRRVWVLLALTQTATIAGDAVQTWQFYAGDAPLVGISDVLWLMFYPLQVAALVSMARRRGPGQLRAAALDACTLATAAALASYLFFVEPIFAEGRRSVLETVVPAAYPFCDVVLLAGVLILMLAPGRRGGPTKLLLWSASIGLFSNVGINVLPSLVSFEWTERLASVALLANVIMTAVVLHPDRGELTQPRIRLIKLHPARVVFLGIALMTAPVMAVVHTSVRPGAGVAVVLATAVCAGLVLARFMIAVREQERAQTLLAFQAQHDMLTGLANRALLGEHLDRNTAGVLLYLDLDGFKQVNDTSGHDAGDAVLTAVADRISQVVRTGDLVARLGGDEFAVACPGATTDDGIALAERILAEVNLPVPFRGALLEVGASIGIASPDSDSTPTGALRAADQAMYQAKRLGRGRWVLAG